MSHLAKPFNSLSAQSEYNIFSGFGDLNDHSGVGGSASVFRSNEPTGFASNNGSNPSASVRPVGLGSFLSQPAVITTGSSSSASMYGASSGSHPSLAVKQASYQSQNSGSASLQDAGRKITSQSMYAGGGESQYQQFQQQNSGQSSNGVAPVPLGARNAPTAQDFGLSRRSSMPFISQQATGVENMYNPQSPHHPQPSPASSQRTGLHEQANPASTGYSGSAVSTTAAPPPASTSSGAGVSSTNATGSSLRTASKRQSLLPEHYDFDFEEYARRRFGAGSEAKSSNEPAKPSVRPPALPRVSPAGSPTASSQSQTASTAANSVVNTNSGSASSSAVPESGSRRTPSSVESNISKDYDETIRLWKELGAQRAQQQQQQPQQQQQQRTQATKVQPPSIPRRSSIAPLPSASPEGTMPSQQPATSPSERQSKQGPSPSGVAPDASGSSNQSSTSQTNASSAANAASAAPARKSNVERFWEEERERERLARALGVNRFGFNPSQHAGVIAKQQLMMGILRNLQAEKPAQSTSTSKPAQAPPQVAGGPSEPRATQATTTSEKVEPSPKQAPASTAATSNTTTGGAVGASGSSAGDNVKSTANPNPKERPVPVIPPSLQRHAWARPAVPDPEPKLPTKEDLLRMKAELDARFSRINQKRAGDASSSSVAGSSGAVPTNQTTSDSNSPGSTENKNSGSSYSYVNVAREKFIPTPRKPAQPSAYQQYQQQSQHQQQPHQQQQYQQQSQQSSSSSEQPESTASFSHVPRSRGHRQSMPNIYENMSGGSAYSFSTAAGPAPKPSGSGDVYDQRLASMSAAQIKRELERFAVDTTGLVERNEFAQLLKEVWIKREKFFEEQRQREEREQAARRAAEQRQREEAAAAEARAAQKRKEREQQAAERKEQEKDDARIIAEVELWARNKPLYVMLNEVNGDRALKRTDNFAAITKAYRRAIIQIHPDKHMDDHAKFVRATEMCKYINEAYQTYKKLNNV